MYLGLGAVTENGILVFNNNNNVIEEYVKHVILIREINGEPSGVNRRGNGVFYYADDIEGDVLPLYEKETFAILLDLGLISHNYVSDDYGRNWLLGHLIQYEDTVLPYDLLDYVYEDNKENEYDLNGWLSLTMRLDLAKWLYLNKGVTPNKYPGYPNAMEVWEYKNNKEKCKKLVEYFQSEGFTAE